MALDPVPWFVGGGAEHSPDVARMVAYAATNGTTGVLGSADFLVTPLPVPGTKVRIAAGGAVINNGYLPKPDFGKQSYIVRAGDVTDLPITATGSGSGRSDLVIVRLDDPQFGGQAPADLENGPYARFDTITNVAPGTTTLPADIAYPAIVLARIDLPAATGTVEAKHITSLRKIANPRRTRDLYNTQPTSTSTSNSTTVTDWAPQASRSIVVPSWASQMKVIGHIAGMRCATSASTGNMMASWAGGNLSGVAIDMDANTRGTFMVSDTVAVPASLRNTSQVLKLRGNRTGGTGAFTIDQYTTVVWDVEFLEVASSD